MVLCLPSKDRVAPVTVEIIVFGLGVASGPLQKILQRIVVPQAEVGAKRQGRQRGKGRVMNIHHAVRMVAVKGGQLNLKIIAACFIFEKLGDQAKVTMFRRVIANFTPKAVGKLATQVDAVAVGRCHVKVGAQQQNAFAVLDAAQQDFPIAIAQLCCRRRCH